MLSKISNLEGDDYLEFEKTMNIKSIYGNYLRLKKEIEKIETLEEFQIFKTKYKGIVAFNESEPELIDINPLYIGKFSNTMMKLTDERGVYKVGEIIHYFSSKNIIMFKSNENIVSKQYLKVLEDGGSDPSKNIFVVPFKVNGVNDMSNISLRFIEYKRCDTVFNPPGYFCLPRKGIGYISPVFFLSNFNYFTKVWDLVIDQDYQSKGFRKRLGVWGSHRIDHNIIGTNDGKMLFSIIFDTGYGEPYWVNYDFSHDKSFSNLQTVNYTMSYQHSVVLYYQGGSEVVDVVAVNHDDLGIDKTDYKFSENISGCDNFSEECSIDYP